MQSRPLAAGLTVSKWPGPRLGDTAAGLLGRDGREARACDLHPPQAPSSIALRATARLDLRRGALSGVLGLLWPALLPGTPLLTVGLGGQPPASGPTCHGGGLCPGRDGPQRALGVRPVVRGDGPEPCPEGGRTGASLVSGVRHRPPTSCTDPRQSEPASWLRLLGWARSGLGAGTGHRQHGRLPEAPDPRHRDVRGPSSHHTLIPAEASAGTGWLSAGSPVSFRIITNDDFPTDTD